MGREHTLFKLEDGSLLACGKNVDGRLLGIARRGADGFVGGDEGGGGGGASLCDVPRLIHGPSYLAACALDPSARALPWIACIEQFLGAASEPPYTPQFHDYLAGEDAAGPVPSGA